MVEILVAAYLIVGLFMAVLLWAALSISRRRGENQAAKTESVQNDQLFVSKTEPIHLHPS